VRLPTLITQRHVEQFSEAGFVVHRQHMQLAAIGTGESLVVVRHDSRVTGWAPIPLCNHCDSAVKLAQAAADRFGRGGGQS